MKLGGGLCPPSEPPPRIRARAKPALGVDHPTVDDSLKLFARRSVVVEPDCALLRCAGMDRDRRDENYGCGDGER